MLAEKIVTLYRKAEMGFISGLSGTAAEVLDETSFYDVGYMQSQIGRIQKELKQVTKELENSLELKEDSEGEKHRQQDLMKQRERLIFHLAFMASNSFDNLDNCIRLTDGISLDFTQCLKGLKEYQKENKAQAFQLLEDYYRKYGNVEKHYLVNKVFGLLLMEQKSYKKAIPFLTYALQFIPDDMECLKKLSDCYAIEKNGKRAAVVDEIIDLLK